MILGVVEVERKKINHVKVIACIVIALVTITLSVLVSGYYIKQNQEEYNEKEKVLFAKEAMLHSVVKKVPKKEMNFNQFKENIASIYHSEEKRVFLTFDDGPSRAVTPFLLDTLKAHDIKATFFLLGSRVELAPDLVKREYEEGHYIANHGYSHVYDRIYASPQSVMDEYNSTENAIRNAIGNMEYKSHLFRFPGGRVGGKHKDVKNEAASLLEMNQIMQIDWNALTADSAGKHTKEEMLEYVKQTIGEKKNVVILMHDASDKILTNELLPELITYLKEQGYCFKTFYDLME